MDMSEQQRLLPSMSMLQAFSAAARHESFTEAAAELGLTQGAISRQVRALERQLGAELFARVRKSVRLTAAGRRYAEEVDRALQTVRLASLDAMTQRAGGMLNLAILPTFGTRWLIPRFPAFLEAHPDITVNFATKLSPFDFKKEDLHAAIHYGRTDWPDTESTFLMKEETVPVAAPSLLADQEVNTPADLLEIPLLHLATRPRAWPDWFRDAGLERAATAGMVFEEIAAVAQAAAGEALEQAAEERQHRPPLQRLLLLVVHGAPVVGDVIADPAVGLEKALEELLPYQGGRRIAVIDPCEARDQRLAVPPSLLQAYPDPFGAGPQRQLPVAEQIEIRAVNE